MDYVFNPLTAKQDARAFERWLAEPATKWWPQDLVRGVRMAVKFICDDCDWQGTEDEVLRAPNPFAEDDGETMVGCPQCREPNTMTRACDELDCWRRTSCGTPTAGGYRMTCYDHAPLLANNSTAAEIEAERLAAKR